MGSARSVLLLPLRAMKCRIELKKICRDKKTIYFLCSRGIGDTILFCTLLPEYRNLHPDKKIALIVSERHVDAVKWFEGYYDDLILVNKAQIDRLNYNQLGRFYFSADNFHYILPIKGISALGYRNINLLDLFRIELGLSPEIEPIIPEYKGNSSKIKELIAQNNIECGKGVILAPYSYSVKSTSLEFWNRLVKQFNDNGYKVITNVQKGEKALDDTICCDGSLNETCELAQYCGYVVSNRSGLCDLMALLKINMAVIYPDMDPLTKFTFKDMKLKANIVEYLVDSITAEQIVRRFKG